MVSSRTGGFTEVSAGSAAGVTWIACARGSSLPACVTATNWPCLHGSFCGAFCECWWQGGVFCCGRQSATHCVLAPKTAS